MTRWPSRMRVASISPLNLDRHFRRWTSKERKNTYYGGLTILCYAEPGWIPLRVVPSANPVTLLRNDIIAISPPALRVHKSFRLIVIRFILGKVIPGDTCRHIVDAEAVEIRDRGGGGLRSMLCKWFIYTETKGSTTKAARRCSIHIHARNAH